MCIEGKDKIHEFYAKLYYENICDLYIYSVFKLRIIVGYKRYFFLRIFRTFSHLEDNSFLFFLCTQICILIFVLLYSS